MHASEGPYFSVEGVSRVSESDLPAEPRQLLEMEVCSPVFFVKLLKNPSLIQAQALVVDQGAG